jgi:hypothetical protein
MQYLCDVRDGHEAAKPEKWDMNDPRCQEWFADSGRIATAETMLFECQRSAAIALLESVAERWGLK